MAIQHRNWRTSLKREYIVKNPGRLPWEHKEPVKSEEEWKRFLAKNDTEAKKVHFKLMHFNFIFAL